MNDATRLGSIAILAVLLKILTSSSGAEAVAPDPSEWKVNGLNFPAPRSLLVGQTASPAQRRGNRDDPANRPSPASKLHGRLVFHRYTNYDAWDGRIYLYDFGTERLRCLSERWEIDHSINANFSPDGKQIVFMGVPRGQHRGDAWDVYLAKLDSPARPVNLTERLGSRDEDPRFTPDGKRILFKQDGEIRIMDLATRRIQSIPFGGPKSERSMPMFTWDGENVVYAEGARKEMDLFHINIANGTRRPLAIEPEIQEYFPIPLDASNFLYVRWTSRTDHHDQVWVSSLDGRTREPLRINQPGSDSSDPFPIDDRLIVFSSTRAGGQGGYDLFLGDREDGASWSLSAQGVNSPQEELGASYYRGQTK